MMVGTPIAIGRKECRDMYPRKIVWLLEISSAKLMKKVAMPKPTACRKLRERVEPKKLSKVSHAATAMTEKCNQKRSNPELGSSLSAGFCAPNPAAMSSSNIGMTPLRKMARHKVKTPLMAN